MRARACVYVCVCARARVRACVHVCACECESNKVGLHFGVFLVSLQDWCSRKKLLQTAGGGQQKNLNKSRGYLKLIVTAL